MTRRITSGSSAAGRLTGQREENANHDDKDDAE